MAEHTTPPPRISLGALIVRRLVPDDAPRLARAITESLEHLRPFLPWATAENATEEAQRRRLESAELAWSPESSHFAYGVFSGEDEGVLLGCCGLHRRRGPGALEIGYWVHVGHLRRGIATAAARAMTGAGFCVDGIHTMEILCDVANGPSAGIPRRLGYRLTKTIEHEAVAPAETGKRHVWTIGREEWFGSSQR